MKRVFITGLMLFSLLIVVGIFFTYRTTNKSKTLNYYVQQQATLNEKDIPVNNHTDSLKLITENFERINSITKRSNIITKELSETLEGGEANFYYLDGQLEKVIVQNFGETFQITTEYYLLNQHLSFIFETLYKYNRPLYYHSKIVEENDDDEIFDLKESEIMEFIYYFND
jgi:cbb3-type cytochrome oxidase subunit 3